MSNTLFPIFLKTETARFLVVGGGNVGLEKVETLLRQNPQIHINMVAIEVLPQLRLIINNHTNINLYEKPYEETDLNRADYVIAATNNRDVNRLIKQQANSRNILVNAADQPELCDFYLGSIVNKGDLKIAVSTNGKSPVLARRIREYLEQEIPDDVNVIIERLNEIRKHLKGNFAAKVKELNTITASFTKSIHEK
ncbi:bifunctional precorrin-2 dehydrogenase/sirohydrochlorin ferrochelatase [Flavobacterium rakeshii]|uniref:precorrin-2 dehydrogenase/sirohydrochlorin ferrochelatase family protein n=1 Tax=Flavobacterium rakeshii TaxID=1038845 RepID=UPI002E7B313E|nr:bifunctional precorrin-2 dehydrogenase/sirohydrochlorin ferrochelatase [Flavobacterium rakeshii]MEE1898592.1 bifunctional precorrin-2 dehydrogenase/sirohydrochlorin ferrochelatase [Flavobacterium rakeshii]